MSQQGTRSSSACCDDELPSGKIRHAYILLFDLVVAASVMGLALLPSFRWLYVLAQALDKEKLSFLVKAAFVCYLIRFEELNSYI